MLGFELGLILDDLKRGMNFVGKYSPGHILSLVELCSRLTYNHLVGGNQIFRHCPGADVYEEESDSST